MTEIKVDASLLLKIGNTIGEVKKHVESVDGHVRAVDKRHEKLHEKVDIIGEDVSGLKTDVSGLKVDFKDFKDKFDEHVEETRNGNNSKKKSLKEVIGENVKVLGGTIFTGIIIALTVWIRLNVW